MSELPAGWREVAIGDICSLLNGRAFKPTEWRNEGLPIVRIQNLNNPTAPYNHFDGEVSSRHRLSGGELLFAWSGTPGTSFGAHIWRGHDAVLNQHIFRVDFDEASIDKRFLRYAINQKLNELIGIAHGGVGLRHVTKGKFEATRVPVPPLPAQKRIADKLDALLARIDTCREHLDRVPGILDRFRQSVLAAATSGELTREWREARGLPRETTAFGDRTLPAGWRMATGAEVVEQGADIVYGIVQPGKKVACGVPYVRGKDIVDGRILANQLLMTSPEIAARYSRSSLQAGDVLLGIIRATKVAIVPPELSGANITQGTARFRPSSVITTTYLSHVLEAPATQAWLHDHYRGIDMPGLNLRDVRRVPVPLPPIEEQVEIERRASGLLDHLEAAERSLNLARRQAEQLTPAALSFAFRGGFSAKALEREAREAAR